MKLQYDVYNPSNKEPDGSPIVMLHCEFDSRKTWTRVAPGIADVSGRKVYVPDARNHGDSPWSEEMSWDLLIEDLETFLDDHKIAEAVLLGHGMGGRTAFSFALQKPNRVEKFISEGTSPSWTYTKNGGNMMCVTRIVKDSLNRIPPNVDESAAKHALIQCLQEQCKDYPPLSSLDVESIPVKRDGDGFAWKTDIDIVLNFLATDKDSSIQGVFRGDSLFIYDSHSNLRMWEDSLIPKHFPRAVVVGLEGLGHVIHRQNPENFVKFVASSINGCFALINKL